MDKMARPQINIKPEAADWLIEIVGIIAILLLIGLPVYYYSSLPDVIPRHYGLDGQPDAYSGKGFIWTLPVIGVVMYTGLWILNRFPHVFNYPAEITPENALPMYRMAQRLIRIINTIMACLFAWLTYATILTALGKQQGLGSFFSPALLVLIFGPIGIYLFVAARKKRNQT
jgi:uncharacterized membrane protein